MKITQISEYSLPAEGGLPPLQAQIYEELMRRRDEVFEYQGDELLRVDVEGWLAELPLISEYYDQFGSQLPEELRDELRGMKERLEAARS